MDSSVHGKMFGGRMGSGWGSSRVDVRACRSILIGLRELFSKDRRKQSLIEMTDRKGPSGIKKCLE
jgi:hypothetical protein